MDTNCNAPPPYSGVTQVQGSLPQAQCFPPQVQAMQPQVQYIGQPAQQQVWSPTNDRFPQKSSIVLGILQVLLGAIAIIVNVVGIAVDIGMAVVAHGIWGGLFVSYPAVHQ